MALLSVMASASSADTVAPFSKGTPAARNDSGITSIETVSLEPGARLGQRQLTCPIDSAHDAVPAVMVPTVEDAGRMSLRTMLVASDGPALVTTSS